MSFAATSLNFEKSRLRGIFSGIFVEKTLVRLSDPVRKVASPSRQNLSCSVSVIYQQTAALPHLKSSRNEIWSRTEPCISACSGAPHKHRRQLSMAHTGAEAHTKATQREHPSRGANYTSLSQQAVQRARAAHVSRRRGASCARPSKPAAASDSRRKRGTRGAGSGATSNWPRRRCWQDPHHVHGSGAGLVLGLHRHPHRVHRRSPHTSLGIGKSRKTGPAVTCQIHDTCVWIWRPK